MKTELLSTSEAAIVMGCSQPNVTVKSKKLNWRKIKQGKKVMYPIKLIADHCKVTQKSVREKLEEIRGNNTRIYA